jgi:serine/threonine protein kinase
MPQLRNDVDLASKYTIVKRLNSGSFGDVYLGLDPQGNEVAIKILIGGDDGDPEAIERERYFCQLVDHPNIIKTYDVLEVRVTKLAVAYAVSYREVAVSWRIR